jgi:hypothetical protein
LKNETAISTYHEYILEGISALNLGLQFHKEHLKIPEDVGSDSSGIYAEINCRYAFLMIANSLEAAANALLLSRKLEKSYYEEVEKLNTLLKFQLFCSLVGQNLNKGHNYYANVKEIIACRNEFVHPKPQRVIYEIEENTSNLIFNIKRTKIREYPHYFNEIRPKHSLIALKDTLGFLSWICFDICKFKIEEGAMILGVNSYSSTGEIDIIASEYNLTFDTRTFGKLK